LLEPRHRNDDVPRQFLTVIVHWSCSLSLFTAMAPLVEPSRDDLMHNLAAMRGALLLHIADGARRPAHTHTRADNDQV
jgi:hypothetical protein